VVGLVVAFVEGGYQIGVEFSNSLEKEPSTKQASGRVSLPSASVEHSSWTTEFKKLTRSGGKITSHIGSARSKQKSRRVGAQS